MQPQRLIKLPEVIATTGLSRSRIYELEAIGCFPKRISLGAKTTVWSLDEIQTWVAERIAARGNADPVREKLAHELNAKRQQKVDEKRRAAEAQRDDGQRATA